MPEHRAAMPHLASRVLGTPLAITERKLAIFLHVLGPRIGLGVIPVPEGMASSPRAQLAGPADGALADARIIDGVAVIPIMGTIVQRAGGVMADSGLTSVEAIRQTFRSALVDPGVSAILFHIDSDGGEVAGLADLADEIRAARGPKPMGALADEAMYSAAYFLGCQADWVYLTTSAGIGSIGTIAVHVDESKADEMAGLAFTVVKAGLHKDDLSSMKPLSAEARARLQAEVDFHNGLFTSAVARGRGLPVATVRGFEALTYNGSDAVKTGLADAVLTFDEAIAGLQRTVRQQRTGGGGRAMAQETERPVVQAEAERPTATVHDIADLRAKADVAARRDEKVRSAMIRDLCIISAAATPDGKREGLALAAEFITSDLTVDEVRAKLIDTKAAKQAEQATVSTQHTGLAAGQPHPLITASRQIRAQILERRAKGA